MVRIFLVSTLAILGLFIVSGMTDSGVAQASPSNQTCTIIPNYEICTWSETTVAVLGDTVLVCTTYYTITTRFSPYRIFFSSDEQCSLLQL